MWPISSTSWDQLFIMADFELDADSPYDLPSKELLQSRPEPLKYPRIIPNTAFMVIISKL